MLIAKTKPAGLDFYVQALQTKLHSSLTVKWGITDAYKAYGRCYRNKTKDGYIAENYEGENQYKEVYWDNTLAAISFFGISNNIKKELLNIADVHLIFFVNLAKIKPSINHRADEEARNDVTGIFGIGLNGFVLQSVDLWLENVLREYPGSRREERLKFVDMSPVHCFRLNLKLTYNPNKIC